MEKKQMTASEMGLKSWEARKAKFGEKEARQILIRAAKKGAKKAGRGKNGRFVGLDKKG